MIVIKIKNAREIVKNEKSWLVSKIAPFFVDVETKVEEAIVQQLQEVFAVKKVDADITIVREDET